ncbi:Uncharacterized protein HZ326_29824 [Fusarium oxysporum f. sp. albedinis]|nr:Uncharacterized protein HZ326_29824 [Fusarium oxysporum f. sp. albedinis]
MGDFIVFMSYCPCLTLSTLYGDLPALSSTITRFGEPGSDVSRFCYLLYPGHVPLSTDKNLVTTLSWHYVAANVDFSV